MEEKIVKHPLHGFSSKYDGKSLVTYLYSEKPQTFTHKEPEEQPEDELKEIWVRSFVKFFEAPIDWYFNHVLGIKYEEDDDTLEETELFGLDYLQQWIIKNEFLDYEGDLNTFIDKGIKEGRLPLKNLGAVTAETLQEDVQPIRDMFNQKRGSLPQKSIPIDLEGENWRIAGVVDNVFGSTLIDYTFSDNIKYELRANLKTLLLSAQGAISASMLIDSGGEAIPLRVLEKEEALRKLDLLMGYLRKGMQSPLKFTLKATVKPKKGELTREKVTKAMRDEAYPNYRSPMPPNKYLQVLWEEGYFDDFDDNDLQELLNLSQLLNL
ncbi:MAG: hypothetical protein EA361_19080 [Bacteroidetes bacterium]|nr:MAG: hypothetical protein EA361_19080 [Bacteroidota bacterium]